MNRTNWRMGSSVLAVVVVMALACSGCGTVRHAVPRDLVAKAEIPGMPEIRTYGGMTDVNPLVQQSLLKSVKQERTGDYPVSADGVKTYPMLAISGGSSNGAYGAGLMKGWTTNGTRPVFKVVTGVSTGALIAPYAFLGKNYDRPLEELYTTISTKDVMRSKGLLAILMGDSLASSKPLIKHINSMIDDEVFAAIAREHASGRRLFVGTANLDAQRFVVWDMGEIAARGDKELFRQVLLASSSIPVMLPPVFFQVEADGKRYDEMHADGGTIAEVFNIYGLTTDIAGMAKRAGIDSSKVKGELYVIRNGYMTPVWQAVKTDLSSISGRALDTLTGSQAFGDVIRLWTISKERGNEFRLAYIPGDFVPETKELFDKAEMNRLFERGYEDAKSGKAWHDTPPGIGDEFKK